MTFGSRPREAYRVFDEEEFLAAGEPGLRGEPRRNPPPGAGRRPRASRARALRVAAAVLAAGIGGAGLGLVAVGTVHGVGGAGLRAGGAPSVVTAHTRATGVIGRKSLATGRRSRGVAPRRANAVSVSRVHARDGGRRVSLTWTRSGSARTPRAPKAEAVDAASMSRPRGVGEFGFER